MLKYILFDTILVNVKVYQYNTATNKGEIVMMASGILIVLLYLVFLVLGLGWIVFLIVLGMKAMRALDIYIRKNQ